MARRYRQVRQGAEQALWWTNFAEDLVNRQPGNLLEDDESSDGPVTDEQIRYYVAYAARRYIDAWRAYRHEYGV